LGCWFITEKGAKRWGVHAGLAKACVRDKKGPVDLFKRFQQGTREPFRLVEVERSSDREVMDPAEVGGLHQVVSEPLFVCRFQVKRKNRWYQRVDK
jgi:hypothetical protein